MDGQDVHESQPDDKFFALWPLRFTLSHRNGIPVVEVKKLGEISGPPAAPVHGLWPQFEADLREGRAPSDHRFVSPGDLCPEAGSTPNAVAQNVRRCRRKLAEFYRLIEGVDPESDLLIESAQWNGYRLDPESRLVPNDDEA